ncbi:MAG: exosortase C-terminal domain/associated protein EpsI, partial [Chthoniobacterales bacterium]
SLRRVLMSGAVFVLLAGITVAACFTNSEVIASPETGVDLDLPTSVGSFTGESQEVSEAERIILPEDTEFAKMLYTDSDGDNVNAQIVLAGAERRSIHRPEVCLPGQGWKVKSSETLDVPLTNGRALPVTLLRIARPIDVAGETRQLETLFVYWFVGKDIVTPSHLVRMVKTNADVLLTNTNHRWAYVITSAPVLAGFQQNGKDSEQTLAMLRSFIRDLAPEIMKEPVISALPKA